MPCERKHVEAIKSAADYFDENTPFIDDGAAEMWADVDDAISAALDACDESPCVYVRDDGFYRPACGAVDNLRLFVDDGQTWANGGSGYYEAAFCRFCGRKIAPLPAAPEGKL